MGWINYTRRHHHQDKSQRRKDPDHISLQNTMTWLTKGGDRWSACRAYPQSNHWRSNCHKLWGAQKPLLELRKIASPIQCSPEKGTVGFLLRTLSEVTLNHNPIELIFGECVTQEQHNDFTSHTDEVEACCGNFDQEGGNGCEVSQDSNYPPKYLLTALIKVVERAISGMSLTLFHQSSSALGMVTPLIYWNW